MNSGRKWTRLLSRLMLAIATISLSIGMLATPVAAASVAANQSNQDMNRPAQLIAPEPADQINLYSQPDSRKERAGYALGGDRATVLRQVGSNEGKTWNYVRLDKQPQTEGWVQEDFIALQQPPTQQQPQQAQTQAQTNERPNPLRQFVQSIQRFSNPQKQSGQNSGNQQSQGFSQSQGGSQPGLSQQQVNQQADAYQQTSQSKPVQQTQN